MKFTIDNLWTYCTEGTHHEYNQLSKWLMVRPLGYQWMQAYRARRWDGYLRLYNQYYNTFQAGLLEYVLARAEKWPVSIRLDDARTTPPVIQSDAKVHGLTLRDYQQEAVETVLTHTVEHQGLLLPWPRGVIEIGTAGGKTPVIGSLAAQIQGQIVILVHKTELLYQTADVLHSLLREPIGLIGDGQASPHRVTMLSVQTAHARLKDLTPFLKAQDALIVDEVHHWGRAKTFQEVVAKCPAYIRIGLSGTPLIEDDSAQILQLFGVIGRVVYCLPAADLIEGGHVAPVTVYYVPVRDPKRVGPYQSHTLPYMDHPRSPLTEKRPGAYEHLIVKNHVRNQQLINFAKTRSKATLVIVDRHEHGEVLAAGIGCPYLSGREATKVRRATIKQMNTGELTCLVASPIFDEGVNAPRIRYLALAAGGKAPHRVLQRIGRGMRKQKEGDHLTVMDCFDYTHPVLMRHSRKRMITAYTSGFEVQDTEDAASIP